MHVLILNDSFLHLKFLFLFDFTYKNYDIRTIISIFKFLTIYLNNEITIMQKYFFLNLNILALLLFILFKIKKNKCKINRIKLCIENRQGSPILNLRKQIKN